MKIREYQPGDEQQILEMDWLLFPDPWNKRNLENWHWKYGKQNPAGQSFIYLMENEGKIIVHFAVVPYRLRVLGHDILASHSIGSMVLPQYQGKGLIKFVADKQFQNLVKNNVAFSYGFPNDLAYDLHKKLMGYHDVLQVLTWERSGRPTQGAVNSRLLNFMPITVFGPEVDLLWDQLKDQFKIAVIRDSAYLNWRYLARPDQKYYAFGAFEEGKMVGYVILKLYRDKDILKGHIIDILTPLQRQDIAVFLIENSMSFFNQHGTHIQSAWVMGSPAYEDILSGMGYQAIRPRPLICRVNLEMDKFGSVLDGKNWYFTMGDTTEIY